MEQRIKEETLWRKTLLLGQIDSQMENITFKHHQTRMINHIRSCLATETNWTSGGVNFLDAQGLATKFWKQQWRHDDQTVIVIEYEEDDEDAKSLAEKIPNHIPEEFPSMEQGVLKGGSRNACQQNPGIAKNK